MTKKFMLAACVLAALASCTKAVNDTDVQNNEVSAIAHRGHCASMDVLAQQLNEDPSLQQRMNAIEVATEKYINSPAAQAKLLSSGVMQIPVVVNVLYRTAAENVSQAQIQSQIDVFNKDFAATNTDYNNTPSLFQSVRSGNCQITFVLDQVVRKSTTKTSWSTNDAMKKASQGGLDAISPTTKLNLWVCNMGGGILGYAQFPGGASATDGVVITHTGFGTTGTAAAPFNLGRTATHEVGHWLNLRHIWGDATCGNDLVGDTPLAASSNGGCPAFPKYGSCSSTVPMMTMNYMDYTNDACMYMFTAGQKTRMQATYAVGGPRASFRP